MRRPGLHQWVVYDHPSDFPKHVVVRAWYISPGSVNAGEAYTFPDLDSAQRFIARETPDMVRLERSPGDDPTIVETWV